MSNKSAAAMKLSSRIAGASPTAGTGTVPAATPELLDKVNRAMHPIKTAYVRSAAERRIEAALGFAIIYALGPEGGTELKLGVASSNPALAKELNTAQHYNSRRLVVPVRAIVVGKPVGLRIKRTIAQELAGEGRGLHGSWFRVTRDELLARMSKTAAEIGAELFDEVERQRRVLEAIDREMERAVRGLRVR